MFFIKANKIGKWKLCQVGENKTFGIFDKFFDCFNYLENVAVLWLFNIKNFIDKVIKKIRIWKKKTRYIYRHYKQTRGKKTIYLRLANAIKINKDKDKNLSP